MNQGLRFKIKPIVVKKPVAAEQGLRVLTEIEKRYFSHPDYDSSRLHVYTDGSVIGNGSANATGGYGVFFGRHDIPHISVTLNVPKITNNIAELKGIIEALKVIETLGVDTTIHYDSDYAAGVITGLKKAHKNVDLVDEGKARLKAVRDKGINVTFEHVYSHTGNDDVHSIGNEIVDNLAKRKNLI